MEGHAYMSSLFTYLDLSMLPWRGGKGVALANGRSLTITPPPPAACGSVGRLCTNEGLIHQVRGMGEGQAYCSMVGRWAFEQTQPQSDRLEVLYLPGSNSLVILLSFCPFHKRGEDAAPAGNKDASHPYDVLAPFSYKHPVLPIAKGRLRKRLTESFGLVLTHRGFKMFEWVFDI